ncbi:helix-turn-helix domain-containing protein [Paenibacillus sp. TAF58]
MSKKLGLSRTHVYEIMRRYDFPTIHLSEKESGAKRVFRSDLMKWLRDRRV